MRNEGFSEGHPNEAWRRLPRTTYRVDPPLSELRLVELRVRAAAGEKLLV